MASTSVELEKILQSCLEDIQAGRETLETALAQRPTLSAQLRPELEAANLIWQMSGVFDPRPGYISASRGRLVEQILREAQPSERQDWGRYSFFDLITSLRFNSAFWLRMVAVMILVIFVLWGSRGVAQASYTALPGDSLYGVKMGLEDATMALSFNRVSDANLHIEFARQRLLEMQMLTLEGRYDEIAPAAHRFEYHLDQALQVMNELPGKDPRNLKILVNSMQDAVTRQTHFMDFLSESVPADTKLVFDRVTSVSNKGLSTANDLLTSNLGIPTNISAAERFVSISIQQW